MSFPKDTGNLSRKALWTVTHLTEAVDSSWTAASTRPQPDHNLLGQVIVWTSDLTTAAWITAAQLPTLTTASATTKSILLFWGEGNGKGEQQKGNQMDDPGNYVPLTKNVSVSDGLGEV
jgi:hypothetical protein